MTEFKQFEVGQKFRIVNADSFDGTLGRCRNGDILKVTASYGESSELTNTSTREDNLCLFVEDILDGDVELVSEPSDETFDTTSADPQDSSENATQASTGSLTGIPGDFLWQLIEGGSQYNGHSQLTLNQMDFKTILQIARALEKFNDDLFVDVRITWNGNHLNCWGATLYAVDYWDSEEHPSGHRDRMLLSIENVQGLPE